MTFYVCFGPWAGWHLFFDKGVRLVLGWVSFSVVFLDVEDVCARLKAALDEAEGEIAKAKANTQCLPQREPRLMIFMEGGVIQFFEADAPVSVILEDMNDDGERIVKWFHPNLRLDTKRSGFDRAWENASAEADQYELSEGEHQCTQQS